MKNLLLAFLTFVTLNSFSKSEIITGNGNIVKDTRQASGYNGVTVLGNINIQLAYGKSNTITVEADENLLPYIETAVENGSLIVKTKNKFGLKSKSKLTVYATVTHLNNVKLFGSGNITGNGNFTNNGTTSLIVSGSGNINLDLDSFNETKITISGSGNVSLKGKNTNNIDAKISGSGNIDCSGIACNDVFANVSGSGNIKVYANRSIDAKVSGSGNIYYKGSATRVSLKSSGSGKIIKA